MDSSERTTDETVVLLGPVLQTATKTIAYLAPYLRGSGEGQYHLLCLDARCRLLRHWRLLDAGKEERTFRLLVSGALTVKGTAACVLAHGHARRSASPTVDDRMLRKRLRHTLVNSGIEFRDHVIFAPTSVWSLTEGRMTLDAPVQPARTQESTLSPS